MINALGFCLSESGTPSSEPFPPYLEEVPVGREDGDGAVVAGGHGAGFGDLGALE